VKIDNDMFDRRSGSFERMINLSEGIDFDSAQARMKNGVLTIMFCQNAETAS
jgi:HSP20 family molecular chaperone IbpA